MLLNPMSTFSAHVSRAEKVNVILVISDFVIFRFFVVEYSKTKSPSGYMMVTGRTHHVS